MARKPIVGRVDVQGRKDAVARTTVSPEALPNWFKGAKVVQADAKWPAEGSRMVWSYGKSRFEATVAYNTLPDQLNLEVRTPSANSKVTWRFQDLGQGRTRIERTVDPQYRGIGKLLAPIFHPMLKGFVRKEQERLGAWLATKSLG